MGKIQLHRYRLSAGMARMKSAVIVTATLLSLSACNPNRTYSVAGETMGTTWHLTVNGAFNLTKKQIQNQVQKALDTIDKLMSSYKTDSDVGRFNRASANVLVPIHSLTANVIQIALEMSQKSNGAFDITAGKLIRLWGFGADFTSKVPNKIAIEQAKKVTGYPFLKLIKKGDNFYLRKQKNGMEIDLSAVAKGFAVDYAAKSLEKLG
ncbi:MAG: FAD:protein FMN transferase, partial [Candidatus Hydrogenedentota bacterium]